MKKIKILALAMSVSLVIGGTYLTDTKTTIAYAEEEKTIDQQIEGKEEDIQRLKDENTNKEQEIVELEKGLKDLDALYEEHNKTADERNALYEKYIVGFNEYKDLKTNTDKERAEQDRLLKEYYALLEDLKAKPGDKDLEKKKTEKAYEWQAQKDKADEVAKISTAKAKEIAPDGDKIREYDQTLEEQKRELREGEAYNNTIYDKIDPINEEIKTNKRKITTLEKQIENLNTLKDEPVIDIDDNKDQD